jgi:uncharacterized protein (DUF433 family)
MAELTRITFKKEIMNGQACIRGMRIPVSLILNLLANGMDFDQMKKEYPDLEKEDVIESLKYAAILAQERIYAVA